MPWLRRSRQMWKVNMAFVVVVASASLVAWLILGCRPQGPLLGGHYLRPVDVAVAGLAGFFGLMWRVRCPVCGTRVAVDLLTSAAVPDLGKGLFSAMACPICGDPGDGSNPKHWNVATRELSRGRFSLGKAPPDTRP